VRTLALLVLLGLGLAVVPAAEGAKRARTPRLKAFKSCTGLISYARRHAPPPRRLTPPPRPMPVTGGGEEGGSQVPVAAPAPDSGARAEGEDTSSTNIQEAGVDEPDIVKSDGRNVFALTGGRLHSVDARSPLPRTLDSVAIAGGGGELLAQGRRALAIAGAPGGGTVLTEIDIANPAAMRVLRTLTVDGDYVSARLHDHTVRVVLSSAPRALDVPIPAPPPRPPGPIATPDRAIADAAKRKPLRARRAGWVPSATLRNRRTGRKRKRAIVACDDVRRTPRFTGAGMLTVLTIDLQRGLPAVDSDAVMTNADTVYASPTSVYVATSGGWERPDTSIHRFDLAGDDSTVYRASGQVPGDLLNQFSLSEHKGVLRAATTEDAGSESQSHVTVLETQGARLERIGQVSGLGRSERIYAVRFIGDRGYVVTFRQIDPLYTLDLSDPRQPKVRGELKILGYSAYLHPVGEHELLGVGVDASEEGRRQGAQLSLFDVADPAAPKLLHKRALGELTSTDVEFDHHAFLFWAPTRLAVIPVTDFSGPRSSTQAIGFRIDRAAGIAEVGRSREEGSVLRTLVLGGRLFALTEQGLRAYDLSTLAPGPFAPF
jgi:uncharacterized secreted protein with C-terminal beta-propeller domain